MRTVQAHEGYGFAPSRWRGSLTIASNDTDRIFRALDGFRIARPAVLDRNYTKTGQSATVRPGVYVRAILESLAFMYRGTIESVERLTKLRIERIRIIGGKSSNRVLNQFTADATGRRILAGPMEATAIGNAAVQILATGAAASLKEIREIMDRSFPTSVFEPCQPGEWDCHAERFRH